MRKNVHKKPSFLRGGGAKQCTMAPGGLHPARVSSSSSTVVAFLQARRSGAGNWPTYIPFSVPFSVLKPGQRNMEIPASTHQIRQDSAQPSGCEEHSPLAHVRASPRRQPSSPSGTRLRSRTRSPELQKSDTRKQFFANKCQLSKKYEEKKEGDRKQSYTKGRT